MRSRNLLIALLLFAALALAACGGAAAEPIDEEPMVEEEAAAEPAEETAAEPAEEAAAEPEGCLGTAEDALVDLECREVTIALENAYLPFNYIDLETGEPGGWDYDFLEEMCTRLHCTPVYQEAAWEGMIQAVADGQYDMAADGITITDDRAEIVDFSDGYINIDQRLLVRKGEDRFASIEDFAADESLVLGTQTGTTNYETATEYLPEDRIQAFEQFPFAVQALVTGDIDAVIIDETAGQGYLGENAEDLELIGDPIVSQQLGFIFPKGSDLVDPVNQVISSMKEDGSLEELSTEYFGPNFSITYDDIGPGAYGDDDDDDAEAEDTAEQPEGCLGTAADALVDLECQEVTVALENAYLPFNYIDLETGEPGGWDYDFLEEMCTRLHCTPVYQEAAWEGMIQAVADGQYDMAADGITITDDRAEIVDFSDGYINIDQRLLVRKGEDRFASIEDFAADESLMLGTQTGTTNYETATEYLPEDRIQAFEQFPFAVQALVTGDIDAVIIDETAGQGYLGENAEDLELIGDPIVSQQLGFIFPKGSDLVDPVNQVISSMKEDGSLEELSTEYFGPNFSITYDDIGPGAYEEEETDG